jgi:hypothetical protein
MGTTGIVIVASIIAVGLFVVGLSLTLIIKGHNIKSEIGENENMRRLGIKCALEESGSTKSADCDIKCRPDDTAGCASCLGSLNSLNGK